MSVEGVAAYFECSEDVRCSPWSAWFKGEDVFPYALAGHVHNRELPSRKLASFVSHDFWVYRFLAAGNGSLSSHHRGVLKNDFLRSVSAAAWFFDPAAGFEGMPLEWVEAVTGLTPKVFRSKAGQWSDVELDAGFSEDWFFEFLHFRYPDVFPWVRGRTFTWKDGVFQ